jgi:MFS family permease
MGVICGGAEDVGGRHHAAAVHSGSVERAEREPIRNGAWRGYLMLAFGDSPFALAGALAIGLSFGAEVDLVGYLTARYFGLRSYGRLYGVLYAVVIAGTALSPLGYGLIVDRTKSDSFGLIAASILLLTAAALFCTMRRFEKRIY